MITTEVLKGLLINLASGALVSLLGKLGKGLDKPEVIARASMNVQAQQVITRLKREKPASGNMMFVKFTLPKDISETLVAELVEEAIQNVMANVPSSKFKYVRFGYERRSVVIKMKHKPRGTTWVGE